MFDLRLAAAAADLLVDREDAMGAPAQLSAVEEGVVGGEEALGAPATGPSPGACALSSLSLSPGLPAAIRILSSLMRAMVNNNNTTSAATTDTTAVTAMDVVSTTDAAAADSTAITATTTTATTTNTSTAVTAAAAIALSRGTVLFQALQASAPTSSSTSTTSDSTTTAAATTDSTIDAAAAAAAAATASSESITPSFWGISPWSWDQDAWMVFAACEIGNAEGKRRLDRWWNHFLQVFDHPPSSADGAPSQIDAAAPSQMPSEFTAKMLTKRLKDVAAALRCAPQQVRD